MGKGSEKDLKQGTFEHINGLGFKLMEQRNFFVFIDYRGHHRKGVAIYSAT